MNRRVLSALLGAALAGAFVAPVHALTWPSRVTELEQRFESNDALVREDVVQELATLPAVDVLPLLLRALNDTNAEVRAAAASAAGQLGAIEVLPALRLLLGDRQAQVREAAATAMGLLRAPGSLDALGRSLADRESAVRVAAATAIAQLGLPDGAAVLSEALRDRNAEVAIAAAQGLAVLAQPGSVYALIEAMSASSERASIAAIEAVAALRAVEAVPSLANLARSDARPLVRAAAAHALGDIASPEAVAYLLTLAEFAQGSDQLPVYVESFRRTQDATPWSALLPLAARDPAAWSDVFRDVSPEFYPAFSQLWAAVPDPDSASARAFLYLWMSSGDPEAIAVWMSATSASPPELLSALQRNGSSEAFCRAVDRLGMAADYRASLFAWATGIPDEGCAHDYLRALHERGAAASLLTWSDDSELWSSPVSTPLLAILSEALQSTTLRWEEGRRVVSWLASDVTVDGVMTPLWALTLSEDVRLQREAAYALGGLADSQWTDDALQAMASRAQNAPGLLKSLVGVRADRLQRLVFPPLVGLAESNDDLLIELLALASRTGAELGTALPSRACSADRFWLRRAGWQYRLRTGELGLGEIPQGVDPWLDGLAMSLAPAEDPLRVAVDRAQPVDVRVAAIGTLDVPPEVALRDQLLADRDAAVVAATWLQLAALDALPDRSALVFRAASAPSAVERAVLYALIVEDEVASALPAFGRVVAAESDAWALRVAQSRPSQDPVQLFVVDGLVGVPVADVPVVALYLDGTWELGRTDAEGRWSSAQPVRYVGTVMP
jgi:HEAT repeat protein